MPGIRFKLEVYLQIIRQITVPPGVIEYLDEEAGLVMQLEGCKKQVLALVRLIGVHVGKDQIGGVVVLYNPIPFDRGYFFEALGMVGENDMVFQGNLLEGSVGQRLTANV